MFLAMVTSLAELRKEIEVVSLEILRLCGERLKLARKIGEIKARKGLPIEIPNAEEALRKKMLEACQTFGVDDDFTVRLLDLLLLESKRAQNEMLKKES